MKRKKLRVKAGSHGPVFREGEKRRLDENGRDLTVIVEEVQEVEDTAYYRRAIASGDLVLVGEEK